MYENGNVEGRNVRVEIDHSAHHLIVGRLSRQQRSALGWDHGNPDDSAGFPRG